MRLKLIGWSFLIGFLIWGLTTQTRLLISATPSLPGKAFLMIPAIEPTQGDLVGLQGHATAYLPTTTLYVKRLVGQAGDRILQKNDRIFINGKSLGTVRPHTQQEHSLTATKSQIIPQGYVFVAATHPRSFDSRYQEFGLVKQEHLLGQVWRLF